MVNNLQLGDTYYTEDNYGEATGYIFIAQQGQFIIGASEYWHYHDRIVDQLHRMCEETLEENGVDMYVHYASKCYATYEEAEKSIDIPPARNDKTLEAIAELHGISRDGRSDEELRKLIYEDMKKAQ